jgi:ubiquinone biosynthesis protein COQ9
MDDAEFDRALIAAAFQLAAEKDWRAVTVAAAARAAGLPLATARARFPGRPAILLRFGRQADQAALVEVPAEGSARDRLFDLLMRRLDVFQSHRAGVLALFRALPAEPPTALLLALATRRSMRWMLDAAGIPTRGVRGELRVKGLVAVWLWTMRTWRGDETEDLSATMAALDKALGRAEQAAEWLGWSGKAATPPPVDTEPDIGLAEPTPDAPP